MVILRGFPLKWCLKFGLMSYKDACSHFVWSGCCEDEELNVMTSPTRFAWKAVRSVENRVVELFLFNDFWQVCFQKDAEKQVAQKIPPKDLSFLGGEVLKNYLR